VNGCAAAPAALHECGEASRRALADRTATGQRERVRALVRATRSAMGLGSECPRSSASTGRRPPRGGRRPPDQRLQFDGGPNLLTEDRQKATLPA
jgi:hypothetical protein